MGRGGQKHKEKPVQQEPVQGDRQGQVPVQIKVLFVTTEEVQLSATLRLRLEKAVGLAKEKIHL